MSVRGWLDNHGEVLRLREQVHTLMSDYWSMASTKDDLIAALKDELVESERLVVLLRADVVLLSDRVRVLAEVCPSDVSALTEDEGS